MIQIIFPLLTKYFSLQVRPRPRPPAAARCPAPRDSGPSDEEWSGRSQGRWRPPLRASVRRIFVYAGKKYLVFIKKIFQTPSMACWPCAATTRGRVGTGPPASTTPPTRTCSPASAHPRVCPPQPPRPRPAR